MHFTPERAWMSASSCPCFRAAACNVSFNSAHRTIKTKRRNLHPARCVCRSEKATLRHVCFKENLLSYHRARSKSIHFRIICSQDQRSDHGTFSFYRYYFHFHTPTYNVPSRMFPATSGTSVATRVQHGSKF
jgi:hypothetical protein